VLSRLARTLEAAIPTDAVLPTVVETTAQALRLPHASIWLRDEGVLRLAAAYGAAPATEAVDEDPTLTSLLETARPTEVASLDHRSRLHGALAPTGATLAYPLQHRGIAVGLLCLAPRGPSDAWASIDLATLGDLARHAGAAVHATRLSSDLQRSLAELQRSRELLVASQEQERRRIQRDLHDGLGPILAAVRLHLEALLHAAADTPPNMRQGLERIDALVGQAATEVRRLVTGLHPPSLVQLGLVPALRAHVEQFGRDVGITAHFAGDDGVCVPPAVEVAVFRVAQEALTNVSKHASASTVDVTLSLRDGWLHFAVRDDGMGLSAAAGEGTGLAGMRERAALLGGRLALDSAAGAGTRVTLGIPVEATR
jgi:signal transduction histidine kinase